MTRILAALAVTAAGLIAAVTHHAHKAPARADVAPPSAPVIPLTVRVSRGERRLPLARRHQQTPGARRDTVHGPSRPAGSGNPSDVTMYCGTGNRNAAGRWPRIGDVATLSRTIPFGTRLWIAGRIYTVMDRIGSGSDFDIFGGDDAGCEDRALAFGRQRLTVAVAS